MSAGYYKRRRGILEHIEAGTIDLLEDGIHDYLSLKANLLIGSPSSIPTGICFTSAPAIHAHCKRVSERTIQRCLAHLEEIGWLKTFRAPNQRGNYPVLLCRASIHDRPGSCREVDTPNVNCCHPRCQTLSGREYRVNGEATTDWRHPVYEPVGEVSGSCPKVVREVAGSREKREKSREQKPPAAPDSLNPWKGLGSDLPMGSPKFQKLFEHYAATRNGNALSDAMERTILAANKREVKVPPPFFEAKREVERREKEEFADRSGDIPVLEAEPWVK